MALYLSSRFTNFQEIGNINIMINNDITLQEMQTIINGKWYAARCLSVNPSDNRNAIGNTYLIYMGAELKGRVVAPCPPFCNNDSPLDDE